MLAFALMRGPSRIFGLGLIITALGILVKKRKVQPAEGEWRDVSDERVPRSTARP